MRSLRRALVLVGIVGLVAGAVPLALALANQGGHQRELIAITGPLIGWAFIGTGIFAWSRQPENRFGALDDRDRLQRLRRRPARGRPSPGSSSSGSLFITAQWALLYHMLLAFPSGTLQSRLEAVLVAAMYVSSLVVHPVNVLFQDTARGWGFPTTRC